MLEIEQKFLLKALPKLSYKKWNIIEQYYFKIKDGLYRIRKMKNDKNESFFMTTKTGTGLVKNEIEISIPKDLYEKIEKDLNNKPLIKNRFYVNILIENKEYVLEIDEFKNGLILLEIELKDENDVINIESFPEEIKNVIIKEVTTDKQFTNAYMFFNM